MKKICSLIIAVCLLLWACTAFAAIYDQSSPALTAQSFIAAMLRGDNKAFTRLTKDVMPWTYFESDLLEFAMDEMSGSGLEDYYYHDSGENTLVIYNKKNTPTPQKEDYFCMKFVRADGVYFISELRLPGYSRGIDSYKWDERCEAAMQSEGSCIAYAKMEGHGGQQSGVLGNTNDFKLNGTIVTAYTGSAENVVIPQGVTGIWDYAFAQCSTVKSIEIPDSVTSIGEYAFYDCRALKSIKLPAGMKSLANSVFYRCTSLESIVLPDGIDTVDNSLFFGCSKLREVVIPSSITIIRGGAFDGCESLDKLKIPPTVQYIDHGAFGYLGNVTLVVAPGSKAERYAMEYAQNYEHYTPTADEVSVAQKGGQESERQESEDFEYDLSSPMKTAESFIHAMLYGDTQAINGILKDIIPIYYFESGLLEHSTDVMSGSTESDFCYYQPEGNWIVAYDKRVTPSPEIEDFYCMDFVKANGMYYINELHLPRHFRGMYELTWNERCKSVMSAEGMLPETEKPAVVPQNSAAENALQEKMDMWYRFGENTDQKAGDEILIDINQEKYVTIWAKSEKTFADPYLADSEYEYRIAGDRDVLEYIQAYSGFAVKKEGETIVQIWEKADNKMLCSVKIKVKGNKNSQLIPAVQPTVTNSPEDENAEPGPIALIGEKWDGSLVAIEDKSTVTVNTDRWENKDLITFMLFDDQYRMKKIGLNEYSSDGYMLSFHDDYNAADREAKLHNEAEFYSKSFVDQTYSMALWYKNGEKTAKLREFSILSDVPDELASQRYEFKVYWDHIEPKNIGVYASKLKDNAVQLKSSWTIGASQYLPYIRVFDKFFDRDEMLNAKRLDVYADSDRSTGSIKSTYKSTGYLEHETRGSVILRIKGDGVLQKDELKIYCMNSSSDISGSDIAFRITLDEEDEYRFNVELIDSGIDALEKQFYRIGYILKTQRHNVNSSGLSKGKTDTIVYELGNLDDFDGSFSIGLNMDESASVSIYLQAVYDPAVFAVSKEKEAATYASSYWFELACRYDGQLKRGLRGVDKAIMEMNGKQYNAWPSDSAIMSSIEEMSWGKKRLISTTYAFRNVPVYAVNVAEELMEIAQKDDLGLSEAIEIGEILLDIPQDLAGEAGYSIASHVFDMDEKQYRVYFDTAMLMRELSKGIDAGDISVLTPYAYDVMDYAAQSWKIIEKGEELFIVSEDEQIELNTQTIMNDDEYQKLRTIWKTFGLVSEEIPGLFDEKGLTGMIAEQLLQ